MPNSSHFAAFAQGRRTYYSSLPWIRRLFALPAYHLSLLTCAGAALLHGTNLPWWLLAFLLITLLFALPVVKQWIKIRRPSKLVPYYKAAQMAGFAVSGLMLWLSYGGYSMDVAIGFLLMCLTAKIWEIYERRDGYIVLFLCFFVLGAAFLWSQQLLIALAASAVLGLGLLGLIALSDEDNDTGVGRVRMLGLLMLPSLPMLLVLFVFFPRVNPLWRVPIQGKQSVTGISDTMSPGDFVKLSQSTELAFRVQFDGQMPLPQERYWRGLVLSRFDGKTWHRAEEKLIWTTHDGTYGDGFAANKLPVWAQAKANSTYQVVLEPHQQVWLFALDYSWLQPPGDWALSSEMAWRNGYPVGSRLAYRVNYFPLAKNTLLPNTDALQLPEGNPKTRQLAKQLYSEAGGDVQTFIAKTRSFIEQNHFYYTLSPPPLGETRIDDFLFGTRQGFCEHYASSFVFMARAAGIPARVVTGYQGGRMGRDGTSFEVRQMDAHAWAEVWSGGAWLRADPTAFVAPGRILDGMADYTASRGAEVFGEGISGAWGYRQFQLWQSLHRFADEVDFYWQKEVVGFDRTKQKQTLFSYFNLTSLGQQVALMGALFVLILAGFLALLWYRRRTVYHPFDLPIARLSKRLGKRDEHLAKQPSESYWGYLQRLEKTLNHPNRAALDALALVYRQYRFGKMTGISDKNYRQAAADFGQRLYRLHL